MLKKILFLIAICLSSLSIVIESDKDLDYVGLALLDGGIRIFTPFSGCKKYSVDKEISSIWISNEANSKRTEFSKVPKEALEQVLIKVGEESNTLKFNLISGEFIELLSPVNKSKYNFVNGDWVPVEK